MINELYEQLKTACNKEERGKITPSEYNTSLPLILSKIYDGYFAEFRSLTNKRNKYNLGSGVSDDSFMARQVLDYYLVANLELTTNNRKATLPNDLFYIESIVNSELVEYDNLPLNKFNAFLSSKNKPTGCFPSYTQYGNTIEIYPQGIVRLNYFRKHKDPKWTYTIISGKEVFNPSAVDFQDIDIHSSQKNRIFNELLIYFGLNRKDQQIQQQGEQSEQLDFQKDNVL